MTHASSVFDSQALERAVPRYTSYPTAPHFRDGFDPDLYGRWLGALPPDDPVSLYLHFPFCDELCWFCACRTQGAKRYAAVERYLDRLEEEIAMVAARLGPAHPVSQMHWGGGSPTVLRADDTARIAAVMRRAFPKVDGAEFAVEIDPRDITTERLDALAAAGLGRASIGVQDFDARVQKAIGRHQGYEMTRDVIGGLRGHGVRSINIDLLYGLPLQTEASLAETVEKVVGLGPDRLALFGYAHVPWMARRQRMIDQDTLPGTDARRTQARMARRMLVEAGYQPIGIDHFAKPGDTMAVAAREGRLKRNFQGYTVDGAVALIGMGASAIGSLPQGYVQNEPVTAAYQRLVEGGRLPVRKGIGLTLDDRIRRDAIEEILCAMRLDVERLRARYGDFAEPVAERAADLVQDAPVDALQPWRGGFRIGRGYEDRARLIAAEFDAFLNRGAARHSLAV